MSLSLKSLSTVILFILIITVGCSSNPTSPGATSPVDEATQRSVANTPVHQCLGYYSLVMDMEKLKPEVIPLRSADWHFNLTGILNNTMGVSPAIVPGESDLANGLIVLDITLTHPFATKPQFSGFDVKGILITPGTLAIGPLIFADADETELENADGYTRWWNPSEFTKPGIFGYTPGNLANASPAQLTATVNPYKLFADRLAPTDELAWVTDEPLDSDLGRAVFRAGNSNTRRYRIRFPMNPGPQIRYGYAIDASWAPPNPNPPAEVPDDFPIEANQPEAYRIGLIPTMNSLYYDSESGVGGGALRFQVNVHDWQGQDAGDIAGEINAVRIFAPDLMPSGVDGIFLNETATKARYTADLTGSALPTQPGEVKIICRIGSTDGSTYQQSGAPAPDSSLSAFHAITLDIPDPDCSADTCNDFSEALDLSLDDPTVDRLCAPNDYRDFFKMEIPLAHMITGELILHCDREPTKFGIYDESETLLSEVSVSAGTASIDIDALDIMPGVYYLRVLTQTSDEAFLYAIEPNLELEDVTPSATEITPDGLYLRASLLCSRDNIVYASGSTGLWIYDWSNCNQPELLSFTELFLDHEPALDYPYLYYTAWYDPGDTRFGVVDVSDPANPVDYPGIILSANIVYSIQAEPGYLYVGQKDTMNSFVEIYDISTDPTNPTLYTTIPLTTTPSQMELLYDDAGPDSWLAVVDWSEAQICIFNVTDKDAITGPQTLGWPAGNTLDDIATEQDYIYVPVHDNGGDDWLLIFLMVGSLPTYQGSVELSWVPEDLTVAGDYAYIYNDTYSLTIVDISNPLSPSEANSVGLHGVKAYDIEILEDFNVMLLAYHSGGIGPLSIENTPTVANCGRIFGLGAPVAITISGGFLYSAESYVSRYSVKSVDIADPADPSVLDEVETTYNPEGIMVNGDRMVVRMAEKWIDLIDCSDPGNMSVLNTYDTGLWISGMGMTDSALYMGQTDNTIEVWDLAGWPTISFATFVTLPSDANDFAFKDDVMYVLADSDVQVYSIVNPLNPTFILTYNALDDVKAIEIDGDYLYMVTAGSLEIADISDPVAPTYIAAEPHPDPPYGWLLAVENQFAILQPLALVPPTVMRVWPPDDPVVIGPLYGMEYYKSISGTLINDGFYYERSYSAGVRIWDLY